MQTPLLVCRQVQRLSEISCCVAHCELALLAVYVHFHNITRMHGQALRCVIQLEIGTKGNGASKRQEYYDTGKDMRNDMRKDMRKEYVKCLRLIKQCRKNHNVGVSEQSDKL